MADGLIVRFYQDAVELKHRSEQEGRPIFEDREFVSIIPIGDNKTNVVREATQKDRDRWPDEYKRYKDGAAELESGTPLKEWPLMKPSQIRMLQHMNVFTVEHLAQLGDAAIQRLGPGGRHLIRQAQAYLDKAAETGPTQHYAAENERLKDELERLKKQVEELASQSDDEAPVKRGPGRPPKNAQAA